MNGNATYAIELYIALGFKGTLTWNELEYFLCKIYVARWCSGYHCCTTSFNKPWTQVLRRIKSCSRRVGDSRWWESLTVVLTGNKAKRLSSVSHTTKIIHRHQHHSKVTFWMNYAFPLKVVPATFLLVCFLCLKECTCETSKNDFYFTSKALFILEIIRF